MDIRKIINLVPGIVYQFRLRPDGSACVPYASEAAREIYRLDPEEIREDASKVFIHVHPDDLENHLASIQASARDLTPWQNEYRLKFDDGTVRWLYGNALPQREADGSTLWHGFITDITERKEAEDLLRFHSEILLNLSEGVLLTRASDGVIVFANPRFEQMFGYGAGELAGKHVSTVNAPCEKSPEEVAEAVMAGLARTGKWNGEIRNIRKDGTVFWCNASVRTFDHPRFGRVWIAVHEDITERKQAEQALRESEEKLRSIYEGSNDAIMLMSEKGFFDCNARTLEMFGLKSKDEFIGMHPSQLSPPLQPDGQDSFSAASEKIAIAFKSGSNRFDWVHRRKNGQDFPAEVLLSAFNFQGRKVLQATVRDITGRKQAESDLRIAAAAFESQDGVVVTDADNLILRVNRAFTEITGYTAEEAVGQTPGLLKSGRHDAAFYAAIWESLQRTGAWHGEIWNRHKDGEIYPERLTITAIKGDGGETTHYVATLRDITEQKLVEKALRENEALLQATMKILPVGLWIMDAKGKIVFGNAMGQQIWAGARYVGIDQFGEYKGWRLDSGKLIEPHEWAAARAIEKGETSIEEEIEIECFDGTHKIILNSALPLRKSDGSIGGAVIVNQDITDRKQAEEQIRNLAFYDALTQLPNRRLLNDRVVKTMAASKRSGRYCALMFLDLDNFKPLNDRQGHDAGDLLLMEAAHRITGCVREADTVARFGGDEFVVVLGELDMDKTGSTAQAGVVAEKIRAILAEPYVLKLQREGSAETTIEHHCTASIGVVMFINRKASPEDILKWADMAMYQAKEGGRNRVYFYGT